MRSELALNSVGSQGWGSLDQGEMESQSSFDAQLPGGEGC